MNNTTELLETGECSFNNCYTEQKFIFIREVQITFLVLYGLVSIIGTVGITLVISFKFDMLGGHPRIGGIN